MKEAVYPIKILISTGIYPPAIGGPALYAKNLKEEFEKKGHIVVVKTYGKTEKVLPIGLRHIYFFLKVIPSVIRSDYVIALDTMSVGLPTILAARILRRKAVVRTGGDFLWESYVERTGDMVLLREFYEKARTKLNLKERLILKLTNLTLKKSSAIIFSTKWQRQIWESAYDISTATQYLIENNYEKPRKRQAPKNKVFVASTRSLKWKNIETLKKVFKEIQNIDKEVMLVTDSMKTEEFIKKISESYAVIIVSLGDISPNTILQAIACGTPFILTRENGLYDRIADLGVFVDPLDEADIKEKVLWFLKKENYEKMQSKVEAFKYEHGYSSIASEFIDVYKDLEKVS